MFRTALAAAMAVAMFAGSAHAQSADPLGADTRCAMIGLGMAGIPNATPEQRQGGTIMALYYIGRMHGRSPGVNLRSAVQQQAEAMTLETMQAEGNRCGAEFRAVGDELRAMGSNGQSQTPAPAPTP
jgi:hypothetical protein